jgi:5-methylcytosine-specific restriction endonuclease McrA
MPTETQKTSRYEKRQGMNWIRPEKRLAIYLRDGLACCYCAAVSVMEGEAGSAAHTVPIAPRAAVTSQPVLLNVILQSFLKECCF